MRSRPHPLRASRFWQTPNAWGRLGPCPVCGAAAGEKCRNLRKKEGAEFSTGRSFITRPHAGRKEA